MSREAAMEVLADASLHPWTQGYVLRPLGDLDADVLLTHFGDTAVTEYLDVEPFVDLGDVARLLDWAQAIRDVGLGVRWSIRDQDAPGDFVGTCGFHRLEYDQGRRGQIGYDLRPERWGQGVMAEVLPAMLDFGFGALGLHRIEAMVTPGNDRSCRLLEKHGFRREGLLRDYAFWRGAFQDQLMYARLASDD